jgi:hypothetical protein
MPQLRLPELAANSTQTFCSSDSVLAKAPISCHIRRMKKSFAPSPFATVYFAVVHELLKLFPVESTTTA